MPEQSLHTSTTFEECKWALVDNGGPVAQTVFAKWHSSQRLANARRTIASFTESFIYTLTTDEIRDAVIDAAHDIEKYACPDKSPDVDGHTPAFSFADVTHFALEDTKQLITFDEYMSWLLTSGFSYMMKDIFNGGFIDINSTAAKKALCWRIGKHFLAALIKLDLLVRLRREYKIDVQYHPLAESRLRTDMWVDKHIIRVVATAPPKFEESDELGRKLSTKEIYSRSTGHTIHHMVLERQGQSKVYLVGSEQTRKLSEKIRHRESLEVISVR